MEQNENFNIVRKYKEEPEDSNWHKSILEESTVG